MRTTLTIDADVAAQLEQLRKGSDQSFKKLVNEALRQGLKQMSEAPKRRKPFRTRPLNAGKCLLDNVDNIGEVLAILEGEDYR